MSSIPAGALANEIAKPPLLSVDDVKNLDAARVVELFAEHLNPGQLHFMRLLGFHKVIVERAEGMYYVERGGRKILDFFGGFGSSAFGHNHPRILAARRKFQEDKRHEIAMAFPSQYASGLAHNLSLVSPGAPRHGLSRFDRFRGHGGGAEGGGAGAGAGALADDLCRELLSRQDQGRAVRNRRRTLSIAVSSFCRTG